MLQDPTSLSPSALALLHAGAVVSGAGLPNPVSDFAAKGFGLAVEHGRHSRSSAAAAFHAELAEAVAYASGARWAAGLRAVHVARVSMLYTRLHAIFGVREPMPVALLRAQTFLPVCVQAPAGRCLQGGLVCELGPGRLHAGCGGAGGR